MSKVKNQFNDLVLGFNDLILGWIKLILSFNPLIVELTDSIEISVENEIIQS